MSASETGYGVPSDDVVIGIHDPLVEIDLLATDDLVTGSPATLDIAPAGETDPGLLSAPVDVTHLTVVEGCSCAACQGLRAAAGEKDANATTDVKPSDANPQGQNIGQLLTLGTNPDGSHFFSGNRNTDAILIGSKLGTTSLPTVSRLPARTIAAAVMTLTASACCTSILARSSRRQHVRPLRSSRPRRV